MYFLNLHSVYIYIYIYAYTVTQVPEVKYTVYNCNTYTRTVEPVLSGTILSGHPLLSGHFSKVPEVS